MVELSQEANSSYAVLNGSSNTSDIEIIEIPHGKEFK
jgi:hypothetical protein